MGVDANRIECGRFRGLCASAVIAVDEAASMFICDR